MIALRPAVAARLWCCVSAGLLLAVLAGVALGGPTDVGGSAAVAANTGIIVEGQGGLTQPGGQATYTLRLLNATDDPLPGGVISYTLPAGFTYVPGSTHVTAEGSTLSTAEPAVSGATLGWGPFRLPAAGHTAHTPRGIHTVVQDLCIPEFLELHLDQARALVGSGGYVTQLFYRITATSAVPDACAIAFLNAAYDRNLVPILRLQGTLNPAGYWDRPDPGPAGDYGPVAAGFARYVAGLPRRDSHPLYIAVWNEPNLWTEWSGAPSAVEYARFFVAVSKAIRSLNDPRIRILNGAVAPGNWDDAARFIRVMLSVPGFVDAFDAWASHCYPYNHPPWYNLHLGTARYGNAAIDCYLLERDVIRQHGGRSDFKFVLTETGYALGDDTYGFESDLFTRIDEANRADYMRDAFSRYWPAWPEVIAVTPFLLGDPWNGWQQFDWIDYSVTLTPPRLAFTLRPQYGAVAALSQPRGQAVPHGIQVLFRARVADEAALGLHTGRLCGQAGVLAQVCANTAGVRVVEQVSSAYLPTISKSAPAAGSNQGVWYLGAQGAAGGVDDGGITPSVFLTGGGDLTASARPPDVPASLIPVAGLPQAVAWADSLPGEYAYIGTQAGELVVVDVAARHVITRTQLAVSPRALAVGQDSLYVASEAGDLYRIDAANGATLGRNGVPVQRPLGMVFDSASASLLVADAGADAVVRFSADLSQRLAVQALSEVPDQVFLDKARGRLLVTLPGANQVTALDISTLQPLEMVGLRGGPVLAAAFDARDGRLYVLSAASARQRIISVLDTTDLSHLALVAGTPATPLQLASALGAGGGRLWIVEGDRLYRISIDDFSVLGVVELAKNLYPAALAVNPVTGAVVWVDEQGVWFHN
jgi:uncharacterized repeat protein (TIGR01451 family)